MEQSLMADPTDPTYTAPLPPTGKGKGRGGRGRQDRPLSDRKAPQPGRSTKLGAVHAEAIKRWGYAWNRERENVNLAYEDQLFRLGDQWDPMALAARTADMRPVLVFNKLPQFVKQVTGDIRQSRPSISVVGVDDRADKKTAEVLSGMIRYIENRSDANNVYFNASDSQVSCGIGHWRVVSEYADDTTFEQELGIELIEDGIAVLWDPDAAHATRKDGRYCFVPVDISRELFKEKYPDFEPSSMTNIGDMTYPSGWGGDEYVRIAEYWVKQPTKRRLALLADGGIDDLTDDANAAEKEAQILMQGGRVEMRDAHKVVRYVLSGSDVIEGPEDWPGRYIPIVPLIGEEVRVGRRRYRHGIVRYAKDPQRSYNYFRSTQTEVIALQPKAPWLGTIDNFKDSEDQWESANIKNWPYLTYTPDPKNGGGAPQRGTPPVTSPGLSEGAADAENDMYGTTGIYPSSLGQKSNEASGKAIMARQREGDTSTYVYQSNFSLALQHTGRVIVDLIPHVYDTPRTIRAIGEDGKVDVVRINEPASEAIDGAIDRIQNDVTIGAYDVVCEMGPSYTTKREQAKDGMLQLLQTVPNIAPLIMDLVAKAQDWPLADKIAKRLRTTLPPQIMLEEAQESGDEPPPPPPPPPPDPRMEADAAKAQADVEMKQIDLQIAQIKLAMEEAKAAAAMQPGTDMAQFAMQLQMLSESMMLIQEHMASVDDIPPDMPPEGMGGPMPMPLEMMPGDMPGMMPPDMMPPDMGAMPPEAAPPGAFMTPEG
jgi:hypothetical protein